MMEVEVHKIGSVLDASSCKEEQLHIVDILNSNKSVILDLSACTYVSSAGLRVLLYSYKLAASKGLTLYLVGVISAVREVMEITGFERFFQFFDTVEDGISKIQ